MIQSTIFFKGILFGCNGADLVPGNIPGFALVRGERPREENISPVKINKPCNR